jgi:hypothetical protein
MPLLTRCDLRVVEQTVYQSQNVQKDWQPQPPIAFNTVLEGETLEGINLKDALNERYSHLDGRDDPMFEDENIGNSNSCRLEVCVRHTSMMASIVAQSLPNPLVSLVRGIPRV